MHRHAAALGGAAMVSLALTTAAPMATPKSTPFKITNIHFETNSSACDMGIQISFDTNGLTMGEVEAPNGRVVYRFGSVRGMEGTHDVTEGFQERVEPPIIDLQNALGCDPSDRAIPLSKLLAGWPAGIYEFEGRSGRETFEGHARLTHRVPEGPEIRWPLAGDIVDDKAALVVSWEAVTEPILPSLGPVDVVGYHVLVVDVTQPVLPPGQLKTSLDADLSSSETSFVVPEQYLEPNRIYELEVLAVEAGGNQTITEGGVFCTPPITRAKCVKP